MNVLVLGATGLAGSAVMGALQADGHRVSGTCRTPSEHSGPLLPLDVNQPKSVVPLLERERPDAVVSCLRGDFGCQLETHRLAADYLRRHSGLLLYLSTANVFDGDLSRPHYEDDPLASDTSYGQFKIACERLLREQLGENLVILRPPEVWGRHCPRLRALTQNLREGLPLQTYENLSVNYTTDLQIARWISYILKRGLRGVFHVGTRDMSDYTGFLDRLTRGLGLPCPVYQVCPNGTPAYQAVLPGRRDIPESLQMSVCDVLDHLGAHKQAPE